jgi:chemotaxis protein methyltransferase CheR
VSDLNRVAMMAPAPAALHRTSSDGNRRVAAELSDLDFANFQRFIHAAAGITLSPGKKALVSGRLAKRLAPCQVTSYAQYHDLLMGGSAPAEVQIAVDLLTTNETYFFRESKHFDQLRQLAMAVRGQRQPFRVWSAASSSGEEAYSIAMVLADCLGDVPWEVMGSDISLSVLKKASTGHYPMERGRHIPPAYLKRFCLKGGGAEEGTFLVDRSVRSRVQFIQVNLNANLPQLGLFDVIFLRNVMIYFNGDTKRSVVSRVLAQLKPEGHFLIGHSETLNDISDRVQQLAPSIYIKR